jgi:hypothetical protein
MVFLWVFPLKPSFSYGFNFPMVFPLKPSFSFGFPMVFPLKPSFSYGFPMVFPLKPSFSYGFHMVFLWSLRSQNIMCRSCRRIPPGLEFSLACALDKNATAVFFWFSW